jgi:serine/threonine protein kinase
VREGVDLSNNQRMAIKIISKRKLARIPGGMKTIKHEARILSQLNHENIIKLSEKFTVAEKEKT